MNLQTLKERIELIENTIKQHVDQINALNGHLAESKYWKDLLEEAKKKDVEEEANW